MEPSTTTTVSPAVTTVPTTDAPGSTSTSTVVTVTTVIAPTSTDAAEVSPTDPPDTGPPTTATPDAIAQLQSELVGTWQGPATVPSGWLEIGDVTIEFDADGTYTAANSGADNPAFYYGINCACPSNTYRIVDINSDGTAELDIDISWDGGNYTTRGLIHRLEISGDTLTFEFFRTWNGTYGPIQYQLTRTAS